MTTSYRRERTLTPEEAVDRALTHLFDIGVDATIKRVGNASPTYVCLLRDSHSGKLLNSGYGKGVPSPANPILSMAGSLMEALEHHYTNYENMTCRMAVLPPAQTGLDYFVGDRPATIIMETPDFPMAMREYFELHSSNKHWWPLVLSSPFYYTTSDVRMLGDNYDYSTIRRYTTNSGTASGFGLDEAILHGVNELIERDALSNLLVKLYIKKSHSKLSLVSRTSLPNTLFSHLENAERELGLNICLIDITSDLGIPTYIAFPLQDDRAGFTQFGAGTSLDAEYAAERAITELCQLAHLVDKTNAKGEELVLTGNFKNYPDLLRCSEFDLGSFVESGLRTFIDFRNTCSGVIDLKCQLKIIKSRLDSKGIKILYSVNAEFDNGLCVVSVVCPKLERFNLVLYGNVVLPGERGLSLLENECDHGTPACHQINSK